MRCLAPWITVLLVTASLPLGILSVKVLLATLVMKAVGTAVFEAPVALGAAQSGEPGAELTKQVVAGALIRGRKIGALVGLGLFALLWIAV